MKKALLVALMVVLSTGLAAAKDFEVTKKAGDLNVVVSIDKNPPVTGDNNVTVAIKDASGKAVKDAKVVVHYSMPPMTGMPAMNYKTDASLGGDVYKATMALSMSGGWNIAVKITRGTRTETVKFSIDAQ